MDETRSCWLHGWLQVGEFAALDVISMKGMKAYVCSFIQAAEGNPGQYWERPWWRSTDSVSKSRYLSLYCYTLGKNVKFLTNPLATGADDEVCLRNRWGRINIAHYYFILGAIIWEYFSSGCNYILRKNISRPKSQYHPIIYFFRLEIGSQEKDFYVWVIFRFGSRNIFPRDVITSRGKIFQDPTPNLPQ